ncbi:MAG: glycosyltransferase family 4 protein [Pyrinomonadaceae bacterium]
MARIAILSPSMFSGDAVSNDVLGMYAALSGQGYDVRIFSEGWTISTPKVWPAHTIKGFLKDRADVLIYHYSRGWAPGLDLVRDQKYRTVIKYHNVTPPEFFASYSSDYARMCQDGREELGPISQANCELYLSDSAFNMRDVLAAGVSESKCFVVPPFHHIDQIVALEPDASVSKAFEDGQTNICMVGRVAPNKGHPALIEAFTAYHRDYNSHSRLLIVGKEETRLGKYSRLLREMVKRLGLQGHVVFTGGVSDQALKSCYLASRAFMITSEHEGFCVPLVEAMALRLPIVAYASSAITDTVDNVGLVWEERNPYLLAESIHSIVGDQSISGSLSEKGWRRYQQHFTNEKIEACFLAAIRKLL